MLSNFAIPDSQPNAQRTVQKKLTGLHRAVLLVGVVDVLVGVVCAVSGRHKQF